MSILREGLKPYGEDPSTANADQTGLRSRKPDLPETKEEGRARPTRENQNPIDAGLYPSADGECGSH